MSCTVHILINLQNLHLLYDDYMKMYVFECIYLMEFSRRLDENDGIIQLKFRFRSTPWYHDLTNCTGAYLNYSIPSPLYELFITAHMNWYVCRRANDFVF